MNGVLLRIMQFLKHPMLLGLLIGFCLGIGNCYFFRPSFFTLPVNNQETIDQIKDLKQEIAGLKEEIRDTNSPSIDKASMDLKLDELSQSLASLQNRGHEKISDLFSKNQSQISKKLVDLGQRINTLDKKQNPIVYKDKRYLPFEIISIDSIQQVSVLTVRYDYKVIPLEKGDSIAGWSIIHVNYGTQKVEFENKKKERVIVALEVSHDF